jgi:hypothetical protein
MKADASVKHQAHTLKRNSEQCFREINGPGNEIQPKLLNVLEKEFSLCAIEETADDINNLLASVIGNISLAKMELKPGSSAARYLVEAEKACIRTKAFTRKLMDIPVKTETANKVCFINQTQGEVPSKLHYSQD